MKTVKIAELKDHLSHYLRAVDGGAEVIVTDRNRPIARIVAFGPTGRKATIQPAKVSFKTIRAKRRPATWALSSSELLAEERRER